MQLKFRKPNEMEVDEPILQQNVSSPGPSKRFIPTTTSHFEEDLGQPSKKIRADSNIVRFKFYFLYNDEYIFVCSFCDVLFV